MKRQAGIGALLLVCVGVVLGATVFRADIAQATGLAAGPSVTVANTPSQAVPVREQNTDGDGNVKVHEQGTPTVNVNNLDGDGNVKVHEQGTAAVHVDNTSLPVESALATKRFACISVIAVGTDLNCASSIDEINASMILVVGRAGTGFYNVELQKEGEIVLDLDVRTGDVYTLPMPQPVAIDNALIHCFGPPNLYSSCFPSIQLIGS